MWCQENNLFLSVRKTKELIVDYRQWRGAHTPIHIDRAVVILRKLYSCTIESILTGCLTIWYGNCKAPQRKALQRVLTSLGPSSLPSRTFIPGGVRGRHKKMVKDSSQPSHRLFLMLPHSKQYQCTDFGSNMTLNSIIPQSHKTAKQDC